MSILSIFYFNNSLYGQCMPGDIGGTVFRELPANGLAGANVYGVMDANESGEPGITVTVTDVNDVVQTTTTDNQGDWWITPAAYPVRVEFTWSDAYLEATTGVSNNQIVRIENAANCAVDLGVQYPTDYAQAMPEVIVNCYVPGDPLGGGTSGTLDAVVTFPYGRTGTMPEPDKDVLMSEIGATWGLAYNPYTEVAFVSAMMKRHVGLGSLGIGGIYAIDYSGATPVTTTLVDLDAMGINLGTEPVRNLAIDFDTPESDSLMFDTPGKLGMGDLDISDDGQTLYVVNLNDKEIVAIDLTAYNANGTLPTMSDVSSLGLIPSPGCAFGTSRPFGLKYYQGQIYAGVVCSGENGGTALDLSATVYAYDLATSTWNTALATFPLDYTRGEVVGGSCTEWEPWISTYDGDFENCSPTPLLSSLDFDVDGSMIMAFTDRYTLQKFTFQRNLTDTQSETVISGGDLLRASLNAGTFVLESAGTTANGGGCGANGEGPNGGEYYCGDLITPDHFETVMGAIAILHGTDDAIVTVMNPIDGTFNSGGVKMFNNNDGTSADGYLLYQTTTFPGGNGNAVKGGGLGDIELLKDPAPVEICSYLWLDSDNDGSYDADETGLVGIEVSLLTTDGTTVGTTTTDAEGAFCFNNNLEYFTDYHLAIGTNGDFNTTTGIIQDSLSLTFPNNTSGPTAELHDSDAVIASGINPSVDGYPYLAFNSGGGGMNTNDLATGFSVLDCPVINNPSAPQTICSGDTITSLQVGTDATDADAIAFVYFADQQTGSDMYSGGIPLDTVTPSGGLGIINDIVLPLNGTASDEDYFIYAITNPVSGDVNCRPFEEIIITVSPAPNLSVTSNSPICEGTDIMLNENGGVAVDWSWQGPSFSAGSIQNPTILNATVADNGMYYVTITDALTCTNVDSTFVTVTGSGSITFGNTGPFCVMQAPENITATPTGGTFSGTGITDGAMGTFDPAIAGTGVTTITYNFTDGNGCSGSATVDVTVLASPTVSLDPLGPFCVTDPDTLLVGLPAGGTYTGVGIIDGINGRFDPGVAGPGTHTISYTFTNVQGCSETATTDITVGAIPSVSLDGAGPFCRSNPPVTLTGNPSGGLFYGVGITDTMGGIFDPSVANAGINTIQYVFHHPDGCSNVAFTDIVVPVPNIQITAAGPFCTIDPATILNATPAGGTFSGTGITNGAGGIFDPSVAGAGSHTITYEYTDGNGCMGTGTSTIIVSDCNGTFGDFVWIDSNNNGIQEIGESGFSNLTVNLYDANTDMLLNTTMTDAMGMYSFTGLTTGDFYIIFDTTGIGEQYTFSPMDIGTDDLDSDVNSAGQTPDFMGTAGFDVLDIDAGLVPVADIGDFVFNDLNNDGIQDVGEPGIEGVTVNLYDANTDAIIATVMTDASGNYVLDRIPPGDYYIEYDPTTNVNGDSFVFAPQDATTDDLDSDINPSTGFTPTFTFDPTTGDDTDIDAGFIQAGSIGDFVFADYNGNGIQEAGEVGIGGVMVILNDNVGTPLDTVFTDVNGNYTFDGITAGDYFVSFDNTTNTDGNTFLGTSINAGMDDALDSDIDPIASRTAVFTFDPTTGNDIDTDAGFIPVMTIGDFVFDDVNEDGIQDIGESGIEGVTVRLYNAANDAIIGTTTTDAMGLYSFPNTVFGNYYLEFDGSTNTNGNSLNVSPQNATTDDLDSDIDQTTNQTASFIADPLNGDNLDIDAGFFQLTIFSIGNFVWQDNNGNGIQDAGEPGLPNVDVFLADAVTDALIGSATTDVSGTYQIDNIPAGNYYILFDNSNYSTYNFSPQDAGIDDSVDSDTDAGGQTANFSITNANNFDLDAGLIPNVVSNTIGDFVFEDLNEDGIQDVGEPGIEGVTVTLFDDNDVQIATTTTDASGAYVFNNIPAGDYYVNFDATTNTAGTTFTNSPVGATTDDLDSDVNPLTGNTAIFTFDPSAPNDDIDAGFYEPAVPTNTIGDFVFEDLNEDGIQDVGEPGIEGVTVTLFDDNDVQIATTTTDASGAYVFNNIPAGDYYVNFDATTNTAGTTFTNSPVGATTDDLDSDVNPLTGNTAIFTFDPSAPNDDIDAGFYEPAVPTNTIGDFVFEDLNEDGIQDVGEPGIEGVTVTLFDDNDVQIATTTTDASGAYVFNNIPAGDYYVNFDATTNTAGTTFTNSPVGATTDDLDSDVNPLTGNTAIFTFDPSAPNDDIDAGFYEPAVPTNSIGDFVFEDLDEDGIQDVGEPGIEGVTVTLFDDNDVQIATTTTDASGAYVFNNIPAGDYYVNFDATTNTAGTTFTNSPVGATTDDLDSDVNPLTGNTAIFTFDPSAPNDDIDAGFYEPAVPTNTIGDFVFEDLNEDGIQDVGEPGIEGVTVTLFDDNDVQIATTTTDASGAYVFNNIPAGDYYVNFDATTNTAGTTFTNSPVGATTDDLDSDVNPLTGNTAIFTFDPSAPNDDIDAGFYEPAVPTNTIGDFVFEDLNEDGIQDVGEPGIEGVTVTLFDDNDVQIATTTTDASGAYVFNNIPAGDYYVNFDATTNTAGTTFTNSPVGATTDDLDSDVNPLTGNTAIFTFDPSAPNDDIDAGFYEPAVPTNSIGDFVFEDLDEDGIQDLGESGIEGVTVTLIDDNTGLPFGMSTTTDATGAYSFDNVPAGDYYVSFDVTTNTGGNMFTASPQDVVSTTEDLDSDIDASGNTEVFTFDALAPNNDIDAGFFQPAVPMNTIGDFVFQDLNGDGIQDVGEPGIEGVTVTLFDDNDVQIATTTTDASGAYVFNNIPAGDYYVNFDATTNTNGNTFINSPPSQTTDDLDSDVVDQITGNTATFTFDALGPNNTIDAGFIPTNSIGDFVFEDLNEDGVQDVGESGIEGVTVTLYDDNNIVIATTTTDASGAYVFTNVPVGDYYVNFDAGTNTAGLTFANSPQDTTTDDQDSDADPMTGNTAIFTFDALTPNNDIDAGFFQGCPVIDAGPDVTICEGTSTTLSATLGGTIYLWTPTATLDNPGSPTPVATPTVTTTYIVNVSGACNGTDSVTVFVNPQSTIDMVNSVDPSGCDAMDGSIEVTASGGQAPLQYSIDGGTNFSTNNTFTNLVAGTYNVVVANSDSTCMSPAQVVNLTEQSTVCPILFSGDTLLVADGRAPTICVPVSIEDTMNYEITVNGASYTDPIIGCTVDTLATPGMEINLGGVGIYEIAFNNTSTCCQDTLTLAVQGTIEPDTLFEVTPFETTTTTLCADTSDLVGNFATLSLCQTPANGTANLDGSSCITYTPDAGFVGTDTLCLVACDEFGACDTTVMFLQVQPEMCPDFITLENESIMLANCSDNGTICVNIDLIDLNQYSIFDNGSPYAGGIQACSIDTLSYYDYSGLPGAGLTGPYMVDNWTVNGMDFSGQVADMESLKDSMNVWDPTGNWIHVPANNEIRHTLNTDVYSSMDITEVVSSAPGIMNLQQRNQPVDIELTFGAGTHEVIFRESATGCEDTVNVSLTCMCPPLFAVDTVEVAAADCDEMAFYCTPILLTEFINYNVSDNGNPYTQQIQGCDFDSLIIYNYDNFPNQGNSGPYTLDSWIVDGQTFSTNFNTIQELVDSMNVWDVNGNWFISNNFSIDGGDLTRDYGAMTIVQFGIVVAVSPADLQPTPSKVSLPLPIGFHELIFENTTDGCIDTIYVNAACNPCPEYFMDETLTLDAGDCTDSTDLCISVLPADISNYTITDNGAIYNNGFVGCDFDSIQSYLTTSFNAASNYQLDSWMISGVMFGPLSFTDPAALTDSMNVIDPTGNWSYSGLLITGGNALNTYGDLTISDNGTPVATVSPSPILLANGTAMRLDTGFHVVIVTDDLTGCTDTISVQVDCTPAPLCPDFISIESQMLSLADCNDLATACVPVTIDDASRFTITDNGMPYTSMLTACGADTVLTYETVNVPGSGPYNLEDWLINGVMFSGQFADLTALADSMNVWDNSTSWTYDLTTETITGANPDNTYGSLSIRQLLTNSLTVVPAMDVLVGGGTNIELAAGFHEMIFERPDGCMDTIAMTVDCINPDTILANLVIGITDTICLDTTDLAGNIIDIDNVCPDASGTSTSVNFLDGFTCFEVTGMDVGMDTACIVMCDDLGICDTTTFVFNTTSNQVSPPTANPDTVNTIINTSVDIVIVNNDDAGNQTIDTFFIVDAPANGTTFLDPDGVLTYIPALDYCDDDTPDVLTYGICNASGCDSTTVTIHIPCDTSSNELFIHNGFSPNNDGVNDVFMIQGLRNIPNNSLCVFNRWGNQVYRKDAYGFNESGQYDEGTLWDGSWTDQILPDGTYFYLLDDGNGNKYSGYVQIHR